MPNLLVEVHEHQNNEIFGLNVTRKMIFRIILLLHGRSGGIDFRRNLNVVMLVHQMITETPFIYLFFVPVDGQQILLLIYYRDTHDLMIGTLIRVIRVFLSYTRVLICIIF